MDFASPSESDVDMMHDDSMLHVNLAAQYGHHPHHSHSHHQQQQTQPPQPQQQQTQQQQQQHQQQRSLHVHGPPLTASDPHASVFSGVYVPGLSHLEPQPQQGDAMEEYARLMGIKVESDDVHVAASGAPGAFTNMAKIQANAAYFENLMSARDRHDAMDDGANLTSMTLPAGIGGGLNGQFLAAAAGSGLTPSPPLYSATSELAFPESSSRLYDPSSGFSAPLPFHKTLPARPSMLPPDLVGSQTLPPEVISAMIKHNPAHSFDHLSEDEKQALIKEEKSRERNRDHSRKSRLRKKEFVESLKHEVSQLQVYQQICEQCVDCIALVVAEASAVFLYSSAAYTRVLGYQNHQIVPGQTSFLDMVHPSDVHEVRAVFTKLNTLGEVHRFKFRIKSMDGEYFYAETTARMAEKGVVCSTRVNRDI